MDTVECLVIGAGVVGLAVARALARVRREVVVVEAEDAIGTGVSSRNSEVIHAGIYYPTGLAKTRLCVEGKAMLYRFCREYGVKHRRCGKLIVAAHETRSPSLWRSRHRRRRTASTTCSGSAARKPARSSRCSEQAARCFRPRPASSTAHALMLALQG